MDSKRLIGAAIIALTGFGLLSIAIRQLLIGISTPVGILLAATTLVLGAAFTIVGPLAYRTDIESQYLFRIAGWNTLGVIATSVVLWLIAVFQATSGGRVTAPLLSGALVVGVSAFAHVLIGFNDVRRIRAQTVAKQRQKAAVVNRFVRHDLKHTAQLLLGYGGQLESTDKSSTNTGVSLGQKIRELGAQLSETQEQIKLIDELLEQPSSRRPVDLRSVLTDHESTWREADPDATLDIDLPAECTVSGGEHLETALIELIDNAFEHGGDPPAVTVRGSKTNGTVRLEILDNGDGFPEHELALINGDQTETQLQHSSGLGLWLAKWSIEHYDGTLSLGPRSDGTGSKATITLPAAEQ